MICACIDIGSNTTRLLVADVEGGILQELVQQRVFTRLGARGGFGGDKIALVADAVATQVRVARDAGAERLRVVGTHAVRQAPNRDALLEAVEREAGVQVEVLSGDDEARLAFAGAVRTLDAPPDGEVAVVDVGGGSTEVVCGSVAEGVTWSRSLRIGSCGLADEHLLGDPPTRVELDRVRAQAKATFAGLDVPAPRVAYAVGGSATSLRRLVGAVLDAEALHRGVQLLATMPAAEAARRFELHPERVRLLPAGIVVLAAASEALGAPLEIARGGLREGALLDDRERALL